VKKKTKNKQLKKTRERSSIVLCGRNEKNLVKSTGNLEGKANVIMKPYLLDNGKRLVT